MKIIVSTLVSLVFVNAQKYTFPDDFLFGVGTAAYQVEGAWNKSGKGENVWDRVVHSTPERVKQNSTGDVACDAYHKTHQDVQLLKNLGVDFYRFSISWSRILPTGYTNDINTDGIRYYNELIDELLGNGIEPFVTIYHWDLPQPLQEIGGWPNPLISDIFADYADVLFLQFGDRVKHWLTFNEPTVICSGYAGGMAPGYDQGGIGDYMCAHNVLVAHAKAYRTYNEIYRNMQKGRVALTIDSSWYEPLSRSKDHIEAAERVMHMKVGLFLHPIYSRTGDYPPILRERVDAVSIEQGYVRSRLPYFTQDEIELIQGSADFLGLNHYTTSLCEFAAYNLTPPSKWADTGVKCHSSMEWESSGSVWLKVVPWGMRKLLKWIKEEYGNPEVVITENGFSDRTGQLHDCRRINYFNKYLEAILEAIYEDGCQVTAYTAWSFMDNFEWLQGYTEKFGLYRVNFTDDDRPRTPKMSSYVIKNIIKARKIDWNYTPEGFETCEW